MRSRRLGNRGSGKAKMYINSVHHWHVGIGRPHANRTFAPWYSKRDEIFRGRWSNTRELITQIGLAFDLVPRFVGDSIVLVDSADALHYVRWASGRPQDEAQSIISGLNLATSFVVDFAGLAFIGVPAVSYTHLTLPTKA